MNSSSLDPGWRQRFGALHGELAEAGVPSDLWEVVQPGERIGVRQGGYRLHRPEDADAAWVVETVDRHGDYFVASFGQAADAADFLRAILVATHDLSGRSSAQSPGAHAVERVADEYTVVRTRPEGVDTLATCYEESVAATFAAWLNAHR